MVETKKTFKTFIYEEKKLQIIAKTDNYLIVYKPANINVHHDFHHKKNTLWDFIQPYLNFQSKRKNPGIVHRLDKLTSGLLVIALNEKSYNFFYQLNKKKQLIRKYFALAKGKVEKKNFTVDIPLLKPGKNKQALPNLLGKRSVTNFQIKKAWKDKTLLICQLQTGKTHQIRAHLKYIHHPIINDPIYYQGKDDYIYLHAYYLEFYDIWKKQNLQFIINIPKYFQKTVKLKCII